MTTLNGKKVLLFAGDQYEDMELQYPKYRLREAGAEVVVAGLQAGVTHNGKHGYPQVCEAAIADVKPELFDGVVVPGGWMPDKLRRYPEVLNVLKVMDSAEKCIASICHGGWINISADVVRGKQYTGSPGIKDDLINAGAEWVDAAVVVDGHHVSSRKPDDLPEFCQGILQVLTGQPGYVTDVDAAVAEGAPSDSGKHFG